MKQSHQDYPPNNTFTEVFSNLYSCYENSFQEFCKDLCGPNGCLNLATHCPHEHAPDLGEYMFPIFWDMV